MEPKIRSRAARPVTRHPEAVEQDKIAMGLALLSAAERGLATGQLGAPALRAMLRDLYGGVFERIVSEAHREWGTRVFVISGGEPLAYKDQGKGVLDLAERFPDCFFVMHTNGTLIDEKVAERMGGLGNVSPALSVEGMKEKTDARRGDGVFDKVQAAMERLRRAGVITGISLTATRKNAEEVLSDEVVDLFFEEMGVLYAFVFHYMPIGRAFTLDLMMTPEQRLALFERVWSLIRERHIFIADFWNSATASNGCLVGGAGRGVLPRQLERRRGAVRVPALRPDQRQRDLRQGRLDGRRVDPPVLCRHPEVAAGVRVPRGPVSFARGLAHATTARIARSSSGFGGVGAPRGEYRVAHGISFPLVWGPKGPDPARPNRRTLSEGE